METQKQLSKSQYKESHGSWSTSDLDAQIMNRTNYAQTKIKVKFEAFKTAAMTR